ncbi:MAG TPA: TetR/AcrR family transcriptional regulator [Acidimicrobiales bacterium]|nr:TetR/AcrR family transcriptional regulator [Acidimicrobiales bacterium]
MTSPDTTPLPSTDGRNQRRDRNRDAVVSALLELYREGDTGPSAEQIAQRAGISARSLFRYFDDVDALVRTAIARQQQHLAPLYALDAPPDLPVGERIERFVAARVRLLQGMGEVGRVARTLAARQPLILAELARIRHALRVQLTETFAPELDALAADERRRTLAAADVVVSWEAYDLMHNDQGLPADEVGPAMAAGLAALLGVRIEVRA